MSADCNREKDHTVIFPSDAERNRRFYGLLKRWSNAWSRPGLCMHDGCAKTSIGRSHSIPLSGSLRLIAEDGHVLTPRVGENGLQLVPMGLRQASTFPGFCEEREAEFAAFETKREMTEEAHFGLQAFRTICREIYSKRHQRMKAEAMLTEYQQLREDFFVGRLKRAHTSTKPLDVTGLRFENDPIETKLREVLDEVRADIADLEGLYRAILDDLRNGGDNIAMRVFDLDVQLPVCLSGLGVLHYVDHGVANRALCLLASGRGGGVEPRPCLWQRSPAPRRPSRCRCQRSARCPSGYRDRGGYCAPTSSRQRRCPSAGSAPSKLGAERRLLRRPSAVADCIPIASTSSCPICALDCFVDRRSDAGVLRG